MARRSSSMVPTRPVVNPNMGIYNDRPPIALDPRMLQDGLNFRIKQGRLSNLNLGNTWFTGFEPTGNNIILRSINAPGTGAQVAQPVVLIDTFRTRQLGDFLIFGTPTDLYLYNGQAGGSVTYITPTYNTGTVAVVAGQTLVTGTGTAWNTGVPTNAKVGDEISFGSAVQNSQSATWFYITAINSDTSITVAIAPGTIAAGSSYTIRRKFQGSVISLWSTEQFLLAASIEDRWYATNGVDPVVRWNGVDLSATLLNTGQFLFNGSPLICKALKQYSNMLVYGNIVQGGTVRATDVITSDVGNPEALLGGLSGQYRTHSRTDGIVRMEKMGDYIVIYSTKGATMMLFVGPPTIFTFRQAFEGKGPLGGRAVARFANYHEFLAADSEYAFDGATVKEINKHYWREALRTQDPGRASLTAAHFVEQDGDLLWILPQTTDPGSGQTNTLPSVAGVEHYLEDDKPMPGSSINLQRPHSKRSHAFFTTGYTTRLQGLTWDQLTKNWQQYNFRWNDQFFFAAFPLSLGGGGDGKVYNFAAAQDNAGAALNSFVRFGRRATADGRMRALVKRVYPYVTSLASTINVTVRMSDSVLGPDAIVQTNTYDQSVANPTYYFTTPYRRGRYVTVEFGTPGPSQPWELSGYDLDIHTGGRR